MFQLKDNAISKMYLGMYFVINQFRRNSLLFFIKVTWTGKRSVVYLKTGEGQFRMQEIETRPALGNSYVVLSGLNDGDEIVTDGAFNTDAAAQLEGKPIMMER